MAARKNRGGYLCRAQQKGKDALYTKSMWRWVMLVITSIPDWKFKGVRI